MSNKNNGYLVCEKCGSYYALQEGESPEDYSDECDCGGKLVYKESLDRPKIIISFWKAIAIVFALILGVMGLMFIYSLGHTSFGLLIQLLLALPIGVSMGYLPFIKVDKGYLTPIPLYSKMQVISTLMICFILVIIVIGSQLSHLGMENPYMFPYIDIVNEITMILLIMGTIAGIYAHKTKYALVEGFR